MNTQSSPKTHKMILAVLALMFLASFALVMPAEAKTPIPSLCTKLCLRVTDISLAKIGASSIKPTKPFVTAVVTVVQSPNMSKADGAAGILVTANWTLPNGDTLKAVGVTNAKGQATFQIEQVDGYGYTFTIVDVEKAGFTFDKLNSILTKSIK
jgi:hypothetical protein